MNKKPLEITFHNPNTPEESELLAAEFVSRASQKVLIDIMLGKSLKERNKDEEELETNT